MAKLPEDMQTALYLSYFEDMTYEEIARVMKKNKKQVDNLLYRGKERLRELLEEWK
jgi:RNA polymerase sigma-70 factor (ECF subfamily)